MKCKWNSCDNEARTKSPFCSGTCKKRHARSGTASGTDVPVEVGQAPSGTVPLYEITPEMLEAQEESMRRVIESSLTPPLFIQDHDNPDMYAPRTNPDNLNWGESMDADELHKFKTKNSLRAYHNRVPIPGDCDYVGVAV